jgi:predicted RNA-binding protein
MRFEIVVPDSIKPDLQAKFRTLVQRLSAQPELVEAMNIGESESITLNEEQMMQVRQSQAEFNSGKSLTAEQVRNSLEKHKEEWLAANQS